MTLAEALRQLADRSGPRAETTIDIIVDYIDALVNKADIDALGVDAGTLQGSTAAQLQTAIVAAITASAPATLDTLDELAAALGDDANYATTVTNLLATKQTKAHPLRPTGSLYETFPRTFQVSNVALTSGRLQMTAIDIPQGIAITSITFVSGGTGATSPTVQRFGLFDSSRNLLRKTNDDGSTAWAPTTAKTLALTSSFTTTYSGLHYVGCLVAAATPPNLRGVSSGAEIAGIAPIIAGSADTGLTDMPSTAAALTAGSLPYAYVS